MPKKTKEQLFDLIDKMKEVRDFLDSFYDIKFHLEKYEEYRQALFGQCPFKIGDPVKISKKINITAHESSGWYGYRNHLKVGSKGKVVDVDYSEGKFRADVDIQGKVFSIKEDFLKKVH